MALTLKVREVVPGASYCTRDRDAAPFRPAAVTVEAPARVQAARLLERMWKGQRLRSEQFRAGLEVRTYVEQWIVPLGAKISRYGDMPLGDAGDWVPPRLRRLAGRYLDWAASAREQRVRGEVNTLELVVRFCVDDMSPWAMRDHYGISDTRALRIVRESLLDYARRAGWLTEREVA